MTDNRLEKLLECPGPLIADGALGTELQAKGLPQGTPPELWNEARPDAVIAVHASYIEAGSELLLTNSFGANPVKLERMALREKARDLSIAAARLCRQAAEHRPVLGSMGPMGALLAPLGGLSRQTAHEAFAVQAKALAEGGVDGIVLETFYDLQELELALDAALEHTEVPIGCSMTFDSKGKSIMGNSVEDFVERIRAKASWRVMFVGANCSLGTEEMGHLCSRLCPLADVPVWIKPNAGKPRLTAEGPTYPTGPDEFGRQAQNWVQMGAQVIGGCCGTNPAHIRHAAEALGKR
ncbi:MAG: homocysteine S-methyltransferase family protein [Candidatus Bipolaricaulota bacterium]